MGRALEICRRILSLHFAFLLLGLLSLFSSSGASADGGAPNLAYVAGTSSGVSVIDVGQGKVTKTFTIAGDPHMILLSPDGRFLYTTQPAFGRVAVIVARTGQTFCTASLPGQPTVIALSLDASVLYAGGNDAANVYALDPITCKVVRTYKTAGSVFGLAVTAIGGIGSTRSQLWVTGPTSLSVFDVQGPLIDDIPIAGGPQFLSIPNGFTAYVTTLSGTVVGVDLSSHRVSSPLLSGGTFGPMDYDAITGEVYVPDKRHDVIDVLTPIDPGMTTLPTEPNRTFHTGAPPESVAITNDGLLGFVALQGGKVAMLDLLGRQIVYTVNVGGTPHFIITGLYPPTTPFIPPTSPSQGKSASGVGVNPVFYALVVVLLVLVMALLLIVILLWRIRKAQHSSG